MRDDTLLESLSDLLGREALIEGRRLRVVEILRPGPLLVLQEEGEHALQDDLYGQPWQRSARYFHIPLISELGDRLHPLVRQFLNEDEAAGLQQRLFARKA